MSTQRHLGFGSTDHFANLLKAVNRNTDNGGRLAFAGYDPALGVPPTPAQVELLQSYRPELPIIKFVGSEKLHGTNMAVCFSNGELWVQSRNRIATVDDDQDGMAQYVADHKAAWMEIINGIIEYDFIDTITHTMVLDCEWAGGNIQKGNAACSDTDKAAYLFDHYRVVENGDDSKQTFHSTAGIGHEDHRIFNMASFGEYVITLDFNKPEECKAALQGMAEQIEEKSPIAAHFGKPSNVGEGVYLHSEPFDGHPMYKLKAKGEKHGGKPKVPQAPVDDARIAYLTTIAEKVTPTWRLSQAITDTGATERKHIGLLMKWVGEDIQKEEMPTLEEADVTFKDISKIVGNIVKTYYFNSLDEL